jgi:predicted secreted Zn-dependent protease
VSVELTVDEVRLLIDALLRDIEDREYDHWSDSDYDSRPAERLVEKLRRYEQCVAIPF